MEPVVFMPTALAGHVAKHCYLVVNSPDENNNIGGLYILPTVIVDLVIDNVREVRMTLSCDAVFGCVFSQQICPHDQPRDFEHVIHGMLDISDQYTAAETIRVPVCRLSTWYTLGIPLDL